jgi:hypothetical protein
LNERECGPRGSEGRVEMVDKDWEFFLRRKKGKSCLKILRVMDDVK